MKEKTINLLMACNDKFFKPACATLLSIKGNTDAYVHLYFAGNVSTDNKNALFNYADEVTFIDELIEDDLYDIKDLERPQYISIESLYRVIAPFVINCEKLLWLDSDMIVRGNLFELYSQCLNGHSIGVAIHWDPNGNVVDGYFNAGMVLFDIKTIKERYSLEMMTDYIIKNNNNLPWYDETILNRFYKNDLKCLDHKYNYLVHNRIIDKKDNLLKQALIVHYVGAIKPWDNYYFAFYKKRYFWKYGKKTFGFMYYLCFNAYNYLVWPFFFLRRILFKKGID